MAIYSSTGPWQGGIKRHIFKKIGKKKGNNQFSSKYIELKGSTYQTFKGLFEYYISYFRGGGYNLRL